VLTALLHSLSSKLSAYYLEGSLVSLPADVILSLIQFPYTAMDSEDHMLDFILHWYTGNQSVCSGETLDQMLEHLKWPMLSEQHLIFIY